MRTLTIYFAVLLIMRIMGKREIGQLSPIDLVVAIMIAELAAIPMEDISRPLHHGLLPIAILAFAELAFSYFAMRWMPMRRFLDGSPTLIIRDGQLLDDEMRRTRYNLNDLLAQLREKDVFNIADVEVALLETSGKLSVLLKSQKRPATPEDLNIPTAYEGLVSPLIMDGVVNHRVLQMIGFDEAWLRQELLRQGITKQSDVFFASIDTQGQLYVSRRQLKGQAQVQVE
ncbi:DUF421 domain-containing protein [Heliophilum fasciatum]|nr:DUF421 domain-containing protein [Heliophilum fasciatum]